MHKLPLWVDFDISSFPKTVLIVVVNISAVAAWYASELMSVFNKDGGWFGVEFALNGLLGLAPEELDFSNMVRVRMRRSEGGPPSFGLYCRSGKPILTGRCRLRWVQPFSPLVLEAERLQQQGHDIFREREEDHGDECLLESYQDGDRFALYSFGRSTVRRYDLKAANVLCVSWVLAQCLPLCRNTESGWIPLYRKLPASPIWDWCNGAMSS